MQRMSNKMKNMRALLLLIFMAASLNVFAQTITLTGSVTDMTGEPIIGASVLEKGTSNGTIANFDGNFTLKISSNATSSSFLPWNEITGNSTGGQDNSECHFTG